MIFGYKHFVCIYLAFIAFASKYFRFSSNFVNPSIFGYAEHESEIIFLAVGSNLQKIFFFKYNLFTHYNTF